MSVILLQVAYGLVLMMILALSFKQNVHYRQSRRGKFACLFCESIVLTDKTLFFKPHADKHYKTGTESFVMSAREGSLCEVSLSPRNRLSCLTCFYLHLFKSLTIILTHC